MFAALNFSVESGQVLLLEGENGSGKTSLLRIICGYRQPDGGQLYWDKQLIKERPDFHQSITYVGHKNGVKEELTVEENLLMLQSMMLSSEMLSSDMSSSDFNTEEVLRKIGLFRYSDIVTKQLSAGQKRKLALARLLMSTRPFWILDEPFTSLDKSSVVFFENVIKKHILDGGMLVLTSHHQVDLDGLTVVNFNLPG